jgi:anti-anti-sigma factor
VELLLAQSGHISVFRLKGRLSVNGADEFEKQLVQTIESGASRILFALDDLDYISSAGLRVFYVGIKKMNNQCECFAFCGLKPAVHKIFDVVGLSSSVRVFASENEAIAALA